MTKSLFAKLLTSIFEDKNLYLCPWSAMNTSQLRPLKQKVNIMRSLAIVLMLSALSSVALAQFKCENHTLPDGTTCPVDDNTDHVSLFLWQRPCSRIRSLIKVFFQTYPDEDHCSRYWDCYNGCFTHMQCQLNYLYDITTGWCDEPEKVYCGDRDCDGRPCKDDPPVPCNFDCEANGGDGFYPYKDNCIKYVECSNGQAICRTCRKGTRIHVFT